MIEKGRIHYYRDFTELCKKKLLNPWEKTTDPHRVTVTGCAMISELKAEAEAAAAAEKAAAAEEM